jgi:imidazoleglycerol-phosphate dehydratase
MLEQLARHSLHRHHRASANGDLHVDHPPHGTEDVRHRARPGREAKALGDHGKGITPLCEPASADGRDADPRRHRRVGPARCSSSRSTSPRDKIGEFDTELVREWFQAFAMNAGVTLHVETLYGDNSHHIAESCFKASGAQPARGDRDRSAPCRTAVPSTTARRLELLSSRLGARLGAQDLELKTSIECNTVHAPLSADAAPEATMLRLRARRFQRFWAFVAALLAAVHVGRPPHRSVSALVGYIVGRRRGR